MNLSTKIGRSASYEDDSGNGTSSSSDHEDISGPPPAPAATVIFVDPFLNVKKFKIEDQPEDPKPELKIEDYWSEAPGTEPQKETSCFWDQKLKEGKNHVTAQGNLDPKIKVQYKDKYFAFFKQFEERHGLTFYISRDHSKKVIKIRSVECRRHPKSKKKSSSNLRYTLKLFRRGEEKNPFFRRENLNANSISVIRDEEHCNRIFAYKIRLKNK